MLFVRIAFAASLTSVVGGLTSCVSRSQSVVEAAAEDPAAKNVEVEVVSRMFMNATVYLHLGHSRQRLGNATGMGTTRFGVAWNAATAMSTEAQLVAEPLGTDGAVRSTSFRITEGARVVWTIQGHQNSAPTEVSLQLF